MSGPHESGSGRSIEEIEALLEAIRPEDLERKEPPADLWASISAETANDAPIFDRPSADVEEGPDDPADSFEDTIAGPALVQKVAEDTQHVAPVSDLDERRRGLRRTQVFGALVGAAAAVAVILGVVAVGNDDPTVGELASAELSHDTEAFDPLGADAAATAVLVDDNGSFSIRVDDADLPTLTEDDLELWLIEPDATGQPANLVSLGTFDADDPGEFAVPASHDPDVFYVVDISIEPRDGEPTHSGRSILRGPLTDL